MVQNMHRIHKSHSHEAMRREIRVEKCFRECKTSCYSLPIWRPESNYDYKRLGSDIAEETK
jgi:hypothetical protein